MNDQTDCIVADSKRNAHPLLNIVLPAYQAEGGIERLPDFILNWRNGPLEIAVVNDGSTNDTASLIVSKVNSDSGIRLINQINREHLSRIRHC